MPETHTNITRIAALLFFLSSMSGIGLGLTLDTNGSVMVIITTLAGILILVPAARMIGKRATVAASGHTADGGD